MPSPPTARATHGCASAGSPSGPFSLQAYEAADWRSAYNRSLELAGFNQLFPEMASYALPHPETGPRSSGSGSTMAPYVPPVLLKAIAWVESGWNMADSSVNFGELGPPLISHSCAYGVMQIVTGMENTGVAPTLDQVSTGSHYGFNIAQGARILMQKWNLAPEYRPLVGNRNKLLVEDWYYAIWSYHGFSFTNHPLNPAYSAQRGVYRCDGTQSYGSFPYQELVLGCAVNPPSVDGTPLWSAQAVTLPNLSQPAFSAANWNACSADRACAGMDFPTPAPSHTDPTAASGTRTNAFGSPALATSASSFSLVVKQGQKASKALTISNTGTGPLSWRLSPSVSWLKLPTIQGVALGTDIGSTPSVVTFDADSLGVALGNYSGAIKVLSNYAQGLPKSVNVNLSVAPGTWYLGRSQMLSADVNGDGKDDIVGAYDNGARVMDLWTFVSDGNSFSSVRRSYSGTGGSWELSRSRMLAADVNGGGKDDIVGIYDYGDGVISMWSFISNGADFTTAHRSYLGCSGCWDLSRSQILAADVNGDGKDDIIGIYSYGGGKIRMWNFISNGTDFADVHKSFEGCAACWQLSRSQVVAADVNRDGKTDIVGAYDYGGSRMGMWDFISNGTDFSTATRSYTGCSGCWDLSRTRMVAADVNADNKDDVIGIYDYGDATMGMWDFITDGNSFYSVQQSYMGCQGCWDLNLSQMVAADVNRDNQTDIVGAFDYGNGVMGMWHFINGESFTPHRSY